MARARHLLAAALLTVPFCLPAAADEAKVTLEECAQNYGNCLADCAAKHPGEPGKPNTGMAACEGCAGKRAVCEVEAGYEAAKPWVKEKYDKSKKFLQDLWREQMEEPKSTPSFPPTPTPTPTPEREGQTI